MSLFRRHTGSTSLRDSLLRWKSQGFPLDPDNPDHCEAYRIVKNNSLARVSAQSVVLALETGKRLASGGVSCELNVYGVPVVNFPLGLPADLKEFSKLADDLEMFTGANVDLSSYYLLDCSVARQRLGLNVTTFTFSQKQQTTVDLGRPPAVLALVPPIVQPCVIPEILDAVTDPGQPQAARQPQAPQAARQPADAENQTVKRRRLLGDILMQRRADIITAADKGDWHGSSHWSQKFVSTHIHELLVVLQQIGCAKVAKIMGAFVQDVFLERPMYAHLHNFKGVFPEFAKLSGGRLQAYAYVLEHMANFSPEQVAVLDLNDVDMITRNMFRGTLFYQSYCEHTFEILMKEAREKWDLRKVSHRRHEVPFPRPPGAGCRSWSHSDRRPFRQSAGGVEIL